MSSVAYDLLWQCLFTFVDPRANLLPHCPEVHPISRFLAKIHPQTHYHVETFRRLVFTVAVVQTEWHFFAEQSLKLTPKYAANHFDNVGVSLVVNGCSKQRSFSAAHSTVCLYKILMLNPL